MSCRRLQRRWPVWVCLQSSASESASVAPPSGHKISLHLDHSDLTWGGKVRGHMIRTVFSDCGLIRTLEGTSTIIWLLPINWEYWATIKGIVQHFEKHEKYCGFRGNCMPINSSSVYRTWLGDQRASCSPALPRVFKSMRLPLCLSVRCSTLCLSCASFFPVDYFLWFFLHLCTLPVFLWSSDFCLFLFRFVRLIGLFWWSCSLDYLYCY